MHERTIPQAIEDAAKAEPTRGFRFIPDTGVAGFGGPGEPSPAPLQNADNSTARPLDPERGFVLVHGDRASERTVRWGTPGLGLRKGDRVALILPNNDDFVLCFLGAIRAGIIPVPIYPPLALGQLQAYVDNTRHIVAKSGARRSSRRRRSNGCSAPFRRHVLRSSRSSPSRASASRPNLLSRNTSARGRGLPSVHERLHIASQGRDADPREPGREHQVHHERWPSHSPGGRRDLVAAPLSRHGAHRIRARPALSLRAGHLLAAAALSEATGHLVQAFTRHRAHIAYAPNFGYALCVKRIKAADLEGLDLSTWRVAGCGAEPIRPETLEAFAEAFSRSAFRKEVLLSVVRNGRIGAGRSPSRSSTRG